MNNLKLNITINKPVEEVFDYATDSNNISKWYPSIKEEIPSELLIKKGTKLKNRGEDPDSWNYYEFTEFEKDRIFTLSQLDGPYHVRYTFTETEEGTNLEYYEWVDSGELEEPADIYNLELLKKEIEKKKNRVK